MTPDPIPEAVRVACGAHVGCDANCMRTHPCRCLAILALVERVRARERERCAKVVETEQAVAAARLLPDGFIEVDLMAIREQFAAAIREGE